MELTLSRNTVLNTTLMNPKGQALYTVKTPWKWGRRTTTIYRHVLDAAGEPTEATEEIARIYWYYLHSSKLVYNGKITDFSTLMPISDPMLR